MTDESSKILSILERFKDDYRLDEKLRAVLTNKEPAYLTKVLWDQFRDYHIDLGEYRELWRRLHQDKNAYSGEDFLRLIKQINKHFPNAMYKTNYGTSYSIHSEDDLPGFFYGLRELIENKQEDTEFAETMREEWRDLPDPYRIAIGYTLAQFSLISYKEIPEEIAKKIAETHLRHGAGDEKYWTRPHAFPPEEWGALLVKTALADETITFQQAHVLKDLIPFCSSPSELLTLIGRCANTSSNQYLPTIGDLFDQSFLPHLEKHLLETKVEPLPANTDQRWPYFAYAAIYLRLCERFSHTPLETLDLFFKDFLFHFQIGWSGSGLGKFVSQIQRLLRQIPGDRLERLFLQQTTHWYWLPACPTPAILQQITDRILALPAHPDYTTQQIIEGLVRANYCFENNGLFTPITKQLIPYAKRALQGEPCPQRHLFVTLLASSEDPEAIEGLTWALADKAKSIQNTASEALQRLPPESTLPHLAPLLTSKNKDVRLAVASLLAEYPPHAEVFALAQTLRESEKIKDIQTILETVQAPNTTILTAKESQALEDLTAQQGASWKEHLHLGPKLVSLYWQFLEKAFFEASISRYGSCYENWIALLQHFKGTPEALQHAALCIPAFAQWDGATFLESVYEDFPGLLDEIKSLIQQGRYHRPKSMGKYPYSFDAERTLEWFIEHHPLLMIDALLERARDKRKTTRRSAFTVLEKIGQPAQKHILSLLDEKGVDTRCEAIECLASIGTSDILKALQKAAPSEKHPRAQEAFQKAIAKLEAEHFDISNFPETSDANKSLEQALSRLPSPPLPSPLLGVQLPALRWKTGEALAPEAQHWIVAETTQEHFQRRSSLLRALRPRLEDASCYALSAAMVSKGPRFDDGWPLYTQSVFGSPEQIDAIAGQLDKLASSRSTRWGDDGVEALARDGSPTAIRHLDHAHRKGKREALKSRAGRGLRQLADERGMTIEELVESAISDMGFSMDGRMTLSYGPRTFSVILADDFSLTLQDENGKPIKTLPAPRKDDDTALAEANRKHFASVKKQLAPLYKAQTLRMEAALRAERRWTIQDWRVRFLQHPLFFRLGKTLLWEVLNDADQTLGTFLIQDDQTLVQSNKKAYKLPTQGFVRILHPIHLTDKERKAWQAQLDSMGIKPLFPQLQREIFRTTDLPETDEAWLAQLPAIGSLSFINALQKCGYERGDREDGGLIYSSYTKIGPYGVSLTHGGWYPEIMDDDSAVDMRSIHVYKDKENLSWRELPPAIFSEIARDLILLTRKGTK